MNRLYDAEASQRIYLREAEHKTISHTQLSMRISLGLQKIASPRSYSMAGQMLANLV